MGKLKVKRCCVCNEPMGIFDSAENKHIVTCGSPDCEVQWRNYVIEAERELQEEREETLQ